MSHKMIMGDSKVVWVASLMCAAAWIGCGDDGDGDGLDGNLTVAEISDEDFVGLCEEAQADLTAAVGSPQEIGCLLEGIFAGALAGGDPAACESARTACLADPPADSEFSALGCDEADLGSREGCDVTVAEIRSCLADLNALFSDVLEPLSCDSVSAPEATPDIDIGELPESCAALERRCPDL